MKNKGVIIGCSAVLLGVLVLTRFAGDPAEPNASVEDPGQGTKVAVPTGGWCEKGICTH